MGDHEYLRDCYHVAPANDHELVDIVLAGDEAEIRKERDEVVLESGRQVQLVWLTPTQPARVQRVELNHVLQTPITFDGFNRLAGEYYDDPGSWFLNMGFTVRSKRINGHWLQCAFMSEGPTNLTRSEIMSYLRDVAHLEFDENTIDGFACTSIARC